MARIDAHAAALRTQGTVVEMWRTWRGQRFGPYYHLKFRENRRQHLIYLGSSPETAEAVRQKLAELQQPFRQSQAVKQGIRACKAGLRRQKALMAQEFAAHGIHVKGWEFRGIRKLSEGGIRKL
jgi:hypothetical protein